MKLRNEQAYRETYREHTAYCLAANVSFHFSCPVPVPEPVPEHVRLSVPCIRRGLNEKRADEPTCGASASAGVFDELVNLVGL